MKPQKVVIEQEPERPIEHKVLAQAIIDISRAARSLSEKSGLNRKAIVLLVSKSAAQSQGVVSDVLLALEQLERDYVKA